MAEGRGREEWGRMSSLLALIANVNRDPEEKRTLFEPSDFNPYETRHTTTNTTSRVRKKRGVEFLAKVFINRKG